MQRSRNYRVPPTPPHTAHRPGAKIKTSHRKHGANDYAGPRRGEARGQVGAAAVESVWGAGCPLGAVGSVARGTVCLGTGAARPSRSSGGPDQGRGAAETQVWACLGTATQVPSAFAVQGGTQNGT